MFGSSNTKKKEVVNCRSMQICGYSNRKRERERKKERRREYFDLLVAYVTCVKLGLIVQSVIDSIDSRTLRKIKHKLQK